MILPFEFYQQDTVTIAKALLGKCLVHAPKKGPCCSGIIIETEAYLGHQDRCCHSFKGQTPRNQSMFLAGGHAYVYFIYGVHHCVNVVTRLHEPEAVLIRAILPLDGLKLMEKRRKRCHEANFTNGPGKLCQAMGIDLKLNGVSLLGSSPLWIEDRTPMANSLIGQSPRIGLNPREEAAQWPLRFYIKRNPSST